jgi:hypothetical protein
MLGIHASGFIAIVPAGTFPIVQKDPACYGNSHQPKNFCANRHRDRSLNADLESFQGRLQPVQIGLATPSVQKR